MLAANIFAQARSILFLGAHCDDVEIGCGGTMLRLGDIAPRARVHVRVMSSTAQREAESRSAIARLCPGVASAEFDRFRDGFLPYEGCAVKERVEAIRAETNPDIVFTHVRSDLHQDHRVVSELTLNTFRDHVIFEYEVPKFDGDLGAPQVHVVIPFADAQAKVDTLVQCFDSQLGKQWFDRETFLGLMRLRGIECNAPTRYAEAFYVRKLTLG